MHFREFKKPVRAVRHLEFLKTLTLLLLQEIENLSDKSSDNPIELRPIPEPRADPKDDGFRIGSIDLNDQVQQFEIALICDALLESQGNKRLAAKKLRMKNSTLHAKIQRYKIRFEPGRKGGRAFTD